MKDLDHFISESLDQRRQNHSLRSLKPENSLIDFCSNDYLGFARSDELRALFETELRKYPEYRLGSTGSRLLAGNDHFTEALESEIADFHQAESALFYNSGYDANIGIFACLPQRGDTIISDEYIHASIIDGIRLSHANRYVFKHNDLDSLEQKLKLAKGRIFIAVESVYSMDGDEPPLLGINKLAKQFGAALIVDEAHATGIIGKLGKGLVYELGLCEDVFARILTFGKSLGTHGAVILGSMGLRSYLINYSRPFIYTTAASFLSHLAVKIAYTFIKGRDHQSGIRGRVQYFKGQIDPGVPLLPGRSPIQVILVPGNIYAKEIESKIQSAGFDVRAILSPSVAPGSERLRICIHNHNSLNQIKNLCQNLNKLL